MATKKSFRMAKHRLTDNVIAQLETTAFSKGVAGHCGGARPAQIRAAAKQIVMNLVSARRRAVGGAL